MYKPIGGKNFLYPVLGLAGETGEVVEKVKKILFGLSFDAVAKTNLDKLRSRVERDKLQGSGDNR
ncbi:MAG: hypothetical protein CEO19_329 [Parcubacteria group bacterium Gr01-1014_73]|nr:MAG: hypothetical protein CEO19_329 [Parcubacteria group bacterium Gr01-1014_73]